MQTLKRRGFSLGALPSSSEGASDKLKNWRLGKPILLKQACLSLMDVHSDNIQATESFVLAVLEGEECEALLDNPPYSDRLEGSFESMGAALNEGDDQEIEAVMFDAKSNGALVAEDLWMKVSWLSFFDEDASIRFRFSFGVDLEEDVSADPIRQRAAAELAETIFPESSLITRNEALIENICSASGIKNPEFVERILYFNAPHGGAYFHHDLERGHAGVVYCQVSGSTYWLALPHAELAQEISFFVLHKPLPTSLSDEQKAELQQLAQSEHSISKALNTFANDALIHLINETQEFRQYLSNKGHGRLLNKGDAILLPQGDTATCCWHTVFCVGDEVGQALSFAIT